MKISCPEVNKLKEAYIDGFLEPEVRAMLISHVAACSLCKQRVTLARKVKAGMGTAVTLALRSPAPSHREIMAAQQRLEQRITRTSNMPLARSSFTVALL